MLIMQYLKKTSLPDPNGSLLSNTCSLSPVIESSKRTVQKAEAEAQGTNKCHSHYKHFTTQTI